jgi:hypothetical protein
MSGTLNVDANRGPYAVKAYAIGLCILIDIGLSATADFHDIPTLDRWYPMVLIG